MKDEHARFSRSVPAAYDRYLGPMLFQPYAEPPSLKFPPPHKASDVTSRRAVGSGGAMGSLVIFEIARRLIHHALDLMHRKPLTIDAVNAAEIDSGIPIPDIFDFMIARLAAQLSRGAESQSEVSFLETPI